MNGRQWPIAASRSALDCRALSLILGPCAHQNRLLNRGVQIRRPANSRTSSKKPPSTSVLAAFFRPYREVRRRRPQMPLARPAAPGRAARCGGMRQAAGGPADAWWTPPPGAGSVPNEAGADPARAVVTPPHLPAKMNGFYALMRPALGAAWCERHGGRWADSSMHFYAPWLCSLACILV